MYLLALAAGICFTKVFLMKSKFVNVVIWVLYIYLIDMSFFIYTGSSVGPLERNTPTAKGHWLLFCCDIVVLLKQIVLPVL